MFWPLCEAGEAVAAARESLAGSAYRGSWLEAAPRERRDALLLMTAASGRGGLLRGRGVGTLRRRFFFKAIRAWFNFLQTLINVF
ncbi:hypothetical protein ONE63_003350 [Megalurothrips usitatus]|uniref:Uncharacterized protein n=1 Tax=Megalurothrips usitatus TaxID=439358 RepID=A0AAV7XBG3_9NEOP|nr:hypothetical protein ONE63_003350 [Megalurothrips usitatus]